MLISLIATALAAPVAAQSLALVSVPMVFVARPVIQPVHEGRPIAAPSRPSPQPLFVQRPQHLVLVVPQRVYQPAALPQWKPPARLDRRPADYRRGIAQYGPFRVLDARRVALVGETDAATPGQFRAMMRDFPALGQLDMVECPGTLDDRANLKVGRMIREAGLITHVPAIGSVRSGAIELLLAGVRQDIADGAEFAVHSWIDGSGREAEDFSADAPENRQYTDYYREMGMSGEQAHAFYDFTNSVPHSRALWLDAGAMRRWTGRQPPAVVPDRRARPDPSPQLAYADVSFS